MKSYTSRFTVKWLAVFVAATATTFAAENWTRYEARPGSKMRIEGTASIIGIAKSWHAEGTIISGFMEFDPSFPADAQAKLPEKLAAVPKVQTGIPVTSLKCSSGKPMDNALQEAMNATKYPKIEYTLREMTPKEKDATGGFLFETKGDLVVSGVTNSISMPVTITLIETNKLKVIGSTALKMTTFGIKPPTRLGAFSTDDDMKIFFEWIAAKKAVPAAPAAN